ncbi:MAG TPA: transglutaminase domain-containing protein [Terriglobales bacterium]|jgi:Transglutaminase-like superfamily|nr:transglutaminase domain-containing protein [Terriglobales bacterium]
MAFQVVAPNPDNLKATAILDYSTPNVQELVNGLTREGEAGLPLLRKAHLYLVGAVHPVYSVNEWQPVSTTLERSRGSCSQRMALLEAIARSVGIATRVQALELRGSFWYPRFRYLRWFIPNSVLLVWPQFFFDNRWTDFAELHSSMESLVAKAKGGFKNDGESLFDAVRDTPVDFVGRTCQMACATPEYNLSKFLIADRGLFNTRDEAFEMFGSFQHTVRGRIFEMLYGDWKSS